MARTGRGGSRRTLGWGSWMVLGLVGFFVVAMGVIARRTFGIGQGREIRDLERRRDALEAERGTLETAIREASSRARLGPIVEQRLQMYVPADSQVIIIPRARAQP